MADITEKVQEENTSITAELEIPVEKVTKVTSTINAESTESEKTTVKLEKAAATELNTKIQEEKYSLKDLIDASKALGYRKEVVAGAFFNTQISEMTKSEFGAVIKKFLGKKVK